jgi:protein phosphatase
MVNEPLKCRMKEGDIVSVRVRCTQCGAYCQVRAEHVGTAVRCGKCSEVFVASAEPEQPAAPKTPAPAAGFWEGLKGVVRSLATPFPKKEHSDADIELEMDGPAAVAPKPPAAARGTRFDLGAATSPGKVRPGNEDSCLSHHLAWTNLAERHELALVIVADGMGGYEAGDRASALAVRKVAEPCLALLARTVATATLPAPAEVADTIDKALKAANAVVHQQGQTDPACKGMGATAAVVTIVDGAAHIGHIGDCRVWHFSAGKLTQVTRDQTLVARMVELGKLSPQEALTHTQRNEVTQAIGKYPDLQPAAYHVRLQAGDWLLAASDGLHAHVHEAALGAALAAATSAAALAQHLVDLADGGGGSDNCTVVAVRCW